MTPIRAYPLLDLGQEGDAVYAMSVSLPAEEKAL
jgi:hypothetical protein